MRQTPFKNTKDALALCFMERVGLKGLAFLLFLVTSACLFAQSRVVTDTIHSKVLNAPRAYTVILPPSFHQDATATYPVLYLLHGMWGDNEDWVDRRTEDVLDLLVNSGEAQEMVIVTPDAGGGDPYKVQNGYFDMEGWPYETFFFTEFMPEIETRFRVKGDRKYRAVAGLSMGGGGATAYGQHHPDLFCAVYAMSALMDLPAPDYNRKVEVGNPMYKLGLSVMENNSVKFVQNANEATKNKLRTVAWFVDCGDDDFLLDRNIEFYQAMRNQGIPCQFRVRDGEHNWEYWHTALFQCLPFVSRQFRRTD